MGGQAVEMAVPRGGAQPHGWRRAYSLPRSLSHHGSLNSLAGLADWRHKRRQQKQLEAASWRQPAGGLAPKRMRDGSSGQDSRGKQRQKRRSGQQREVGRKRQGNGKWSMSGYRFSADPGSAVMVAGSYTVKAVQTQVMLQGSAGREIWLGVDLRRGGKDHKLDAEW